MYVGSCESPRVLHLCPRTAAGNTERAGNELGEVALERSMARNLYWAWINDDGEGGGDNWAILERKKYCCEKKS